MGAQHPQGQPNPPIAGGPTTAIPLTDIPHMGTSQAEVAKPHLPGETQPPQQQQAPTAQPQAQLQMPPLPTGVSQQDVDAALQHVQQTGSTDGIKPEVLAAACAQLEAQAAAQGIDLSAQAAAETPQGPAPTNHAEAAVMDKKGTFDQFNQQRDALKQQVADQREAMVQTYGDALAKGNGGEAAMSEEQIGALAAALKDLDPSTVNLINAFSAVSANPSMLNSIVWLEIIRMLRRLIANEAQKQIHQTMHPHPH